MRALTVKQPWAWAITYAGKDVENRPRPIPPKLLQQRCQNRLCDGFGNEDQSDNEDGSEFYNCRECNPNDDGSGADGFVPLRVALHAGKAWDSDAFPTPSGRRTISWHTLSNGTRLIRGSKDRLKRQPFVQAARTGGHPQQPFGAVVAVMTLTGSHEADNLRNCSDWADMDAGMWHWQIADVQALADPIPCRGQLGLWTVPADIETKIMDQLT